MVDFSNLSLSDIGLIISGILSVVYLIFRMGQEYNELQNMKKKVDGLENRVNAIQEDVTFMTGFLSKDINAKQPTSKSKTTKKVE
jgi:hypothetical protein